MAFYLSKMAATMVGSMPSGDIGVVRDKEKKKRNES